MVRTIAIHHVVPEHADAFLAFMHGVERAIENAPGLVEVASYRDAGGSLVAIATWASLEAFEAARPRLLSLSHERRPEWTAREDDLLVLTPG